MSSNLFGGSLDDVTPAKRAGRVRAQPQVDTLDVEQVPARRQQPHRLPVPHQGEADRALRPPGASGGAGAPPVGELGDRRQRGRRQPAPASSVGSGGFGAVRSHGGGRVPVGEGAAEAEGHREDDEDGGGGQADEHHRVTHPVAADGGGSFHRVRRGAGGTIGRHGRAAGCFVVSLVGEAEAPQSGPP